MITSKDLKNTSLSPIQKLVVNVMGDAINKAINVFNMGNQLKGVMMQMKEFGKILKLINKLSIKQRECLCSLAEQKSISKPSYYFHHSTTRSLNKKGYTTLRNYANGEFYELTDLGCQLVALITKN